MDRVEDSFIEVVTDEPEVIDSTQSALENAGWELISWRSNGDGTGNVQKYRRRK